jgi:hypothetical protein
MNDEIKTQLENEDDHDIFVYDKNDIDNIVEAIKKRIPSQFKPDESRNIPFSQFKSDESKHIPSQMFSSLNNIIDEIFNELKNKNKKDNTDSAIRFAIVSNKKSNLYDKNLLNIIFNKIRLSLDVLYDTELIVQNQNIKDRGNIYKEIIETVNIYINKYKLNKNIFTNYDLGRIFWSIVNHQSSKPISKKIPLVKPNIYPKLPSVKTNNLLESLIKTHVDQYKNIEKDFINIIKDCINIKCNKNIIEDKVKQIYWNNFFENPPHIFTTCGTKGILQYINNLKKDPHTPQIKKNIDNIIDKYMKTYFYEKQSQRKINKDELIDKFKADINNLNLNNIQKQLAYDSFINKLNSKAHKFMKSQINEKSFNNAIKKNKSVSDIIKKIPGLKNQMKLCIEYCINTIGYCDYDYFEENISKYFLNVKNPYVSMSVILNFLEDYSESLLSKK